MTSTSERDALIDRFLADVGLADADREPLPADASTRRYVRLRPASGPPLMLMDQPPQLESAPCPPDASPDQRRALGWNAVYRAAAGRVEAFTACAAWLRDGGLSAPAVLAADASNGLAVLEDLGNDLFARVLEADPQAEPELYDAAIDALVAIQSRAPPEMLADDGEAWPLLTYDAVALQAAGALLIEWLPRYAELPPFSPAAVAEWDAFWWPILAQAEAEAEVFCHRDYHAENLIWLPERVGAARVGLLDFQDAVRAHRAWDLSMLLHDARRDVSPAVRERCLARYLGWTDTRSDRLRADFHTLGALNVSRILGIFSRLVVRDGKPRYRAFMPRMWGHLHDCLAEPDLAPLRAWFDAHVPAGARR